MADIKAFVAHSFLPKDKVLVNRFLEYLDSIKKILPNFSWDHAKEAKPISVSGKVLGLMEDKNLLITICTPNEYVVGLEAPRNIGIGVFTPTNSLEEKPSDWIIQEIGLAIGRGMTIIVLLQQGVRKPGGLFSDLQYISFSPTNLEECFKELLDMLGTMVPSEGAVVSVVEQKSKSLEQTEPENEVDDDDWRPKQKWTEDEYRTAAFRAIVFNVGNFDVINNAFMESPFAANKSSESVAEWKAHSEYLRMVDQQKFDFEVIKKAAAEFPNNSLLQSYLARGYLEYGEVALSASASERAAEVAKSEGERLQCLATAAENYVKLGNSERALAIWESLRVSISNNPELKYDFLTCLLGAAKAEKDDLLEIAVLEETIELRPDSVNLRFSLAFKHSEVGNYDMALFHYRKIPVPERSAATWNNLGVAYEHFQAPVTAVRAYRRAEEMKEARAMCNLGQKLLREGFYDEAKDLADKARSTDPDEKNLPGLLNQLHNLKEEENKKVAKSLEATASKAAFFRKLGNSILRPTPQEVGRSWRSPDGELTVDVRGGKITISGNYQAENPLIAGLATSSGVRSTMSYHYNFEGEVCGGAAFGNLKRDPEITTIGGLFRSDKGAVTVMYFNENNTELSVMEDADSRTPRFYEIKAVALKISQN